MKKSEIIIVSIVVIGIGLFVYFNFFSYSKQTLDIIPIDNENSLVCKTYRKKHSGWEHYMTRVHITKGEIWKTQIEGMSLENSSHWSKVLMRSVICKNNEVTIYYHPDTCIYKFDYQTGEIKQKLKMPYQTLIDHGNWGEICDSNNIYMLRSKEYGNYDICAVGFDSLNIKWTAQTKNDGMGEFMYPLQNKNWIVYCGGNRDNYKISSINKHTGELNMYTVNNIGFLLNDNYYTVIDKQFTVIDLNTGDSKELFSFSDKLDINFNFRDGLLWNYKEMVIYVNKDTLTARNYNTGDIAWKVPLPNGYKLGRLPRIYEFAPELTPFPLIKTPHLALEIINPIYAFQDSVHYKIVSINLDKGAITWESNEQIGRTSITEDYRQMLLNNNHVFSIRKNDKISFLTINGHTGKVDSYLMPWDKKSNEGINALSFMDEQVFKSFTGRSFTLNAKAIIDLNKKTIKGRKAKQYKLIDLYDESKEEWGFE